MALDTLFILKCAYFMIPAYAANMAPVFFKNRLLFLSRPIDNNQMLWGRPIFGDHKTWRGLIVGTLFGVIATSIQAYMEKYEAMQSIALITYDNWLSIGIAMGFGALLGDLVKSFIKRRFDIKPGNKFFPFDQIDFALGALLLSLLIIKIPLIVFLTCLLLSIVLHVLTNHAAFYSGIRQEKW